MGTIATLATTKLANAKQAAAKGQSRAMRRKLRGQAYSAAAISTVAALMTGLSLDHLAQGVSLITGSHGWQPWAMAGGLDLTYVALEVAGLCCALEKTRAKIANLNRGAIICTMAGSAALNALAFAVNAEGLAFKIGAAALGLAIPALVYVLTRHAMTMALDCAPRS
jgi:hypothetical protein